MKDVAIIAFHLSSIFGKDIKDQALENVCTLVKRASVAVSISAWKTCLHAMLPALMSVMTVICKSLQHIKIPSDFGNCSICEKHVALFSHLMCKCSGDDRGEDALEKWLLR